MKSFSYKRVSAVGIVLVMAAAGCELIVDFDRTKIPGGGTDASVDQGTLDGQTGTDAQVDVTTDAPKDSATEGGGDAATDGTTNDAGDAAAADADDSG